MAGKRLLDAAKLLDAATSVGKQHFLLRQQQWDVYSRTSSLAKAVKNQTDRVTVTAAAAYELAKRFEEEVPSWQGSRDEGRSAEERSGVDRDQARQEAGKEAQTSSMQFSQSSTASAAVSDAVGKAGVQGTGSTQQETKAALRKDEAQNIHEHLNAIQADSAVPEGKSTASVAAEPEQEDLPEGASLEGLFASRSVSRKVGKTGPSIDNAFAVRKRLPPQPLKEMLTAENRRKEESKSASSNTSAAAITATKDPEPAKNESIEPQTLNASATDHETKATEADAETQDLAASIAQETQETSTPDSQEQKYEMHESKVPASRFARFWQYSGLATSMAFGAVGEGFRRVTGGGSEGSLMMSEANMNRLVAKLSRMRGAALKLGQMVSFQDSKILPPTINAVLQRVQDSADYMPPSQRDKVLRNNLGDNWRDLFSNFEEKPFAAASIGQVHKATLASNGKPVAVKVQYPGVKNSIDSDLNNLSMLLTASRLLPKGLFLDKTIANARVELAWECDYEREAQACMRFKELLADEQNMFTVPEIYSEASGPDVLTAEFVHGTAVTKMKDLSQSDRDWVGTQILRLCLRELMEWKFMQTDPNWTNFLYNRESQKVELLDFGASREFPDKFVVPYVSLLIAASKGDREQCRELSIELGYLTGDEGNEMVKAHVDSIMTLAEPFVESAPDVYDFEDQTITDRVRANIGLMLRERLAPPPEETYSLHRKLSGSFLLCARLQSRVRARELFENAVEVWNGRQQKVNQDAGSVN